MFKWIIILLSQLTFINTIPIRGTSLGSLFVLEPFITPSLFYQFLGNKFKVINDIYSYCDYLGPIETNKRLKNHWSKWVTEDNIRTLSESGLNTIRIPVGDYMYMPYGPYLKTDNGISCFSDSLEYLDIILQWIKKYNMRAIIDIHAWKDSQNGFDNSGQTKNMEYYKIGINDTLYFRHWDIRNAGWIGDFDIIRKIYTKINYDNIIHALNVIELVLIKYKDYDMIWGLSPMNEPWEYTPEEELKKFYKNVYDKYNLIWGANKKILIFHDSFRPYLWSSCNFLGGNLDNIYLDTHQYIAWNEAVHFETLISSIRNWNYPPTCLKVIVGEFSLATDNCMMLLNGFMDNIQNYPLHTCFLERCPLYNENNNNLYIKNSKFGPFGTGISSPTEDGYCPYTTPISLNKLIYSSDVGQQIIISPGGNNDPRNIDKVYVSLLFQEFIRAFESKTNGWLFWNFTPLHI